MRFAWQRQTSNFGYLTWVYSFQQYTWLSPRYKISYFVSSHIAHVSLENNLISESPSFLFWKMGIKVATQACWWGNKWGNIWRQINGAVSFSGLPHLGQQFHICSAAWATIKFFLLLSIQSISRSFKLSHQNNSCISLLLALHHIPSCPPHHHLLHGPLQELLNRSLWFHSCSQMWFLKCLSQTIKNKNCENSCSVNHHRVITNVQPAPRQ